MKCLVRRLGHPGEATLNSPLFSCVLIHFSEQMPPNCSVLGVEKRIGLFLCFRVRVYSGLSLVVLYLTFATF